MIGVFDSGFGGLTVLTRLAARFPRSRFVYLGDHAHAPYGPQPPAHVTELTRRGVETLFGQGCGLVVLACNTASTVALRGLQARWLPERWSDRRVLGVTVPTIEAIVGRPWQAASAPEVDGPPRTVGVFATTATVASGYFADEIAKRAPGIRVVQQACPHLAGLIERGAGPGTLRREVESHVAALLGRLDGASLDTVVLGCTHYALVAPLFERALPAGCRVLSQSEAAAEALGAYLERHPRFLNDVDHAVDPVLLTTGDAPSVSRLAGRLFGRPMAFMAARRDLSA